MEAQALLEAGEAALEAAEGMAVMTFDEDGNEEVAKTPALRAAYEAARQYALDDIRRAEEWIAEEAFLTLEALAGGFEGE